MGTVWEEAYTHKGNLITVECVADATSIASTKKTVYTEYECCQLYKVIIP